MRKLHLGRIICLLKVTQLLGIRAGTLSPSLPAPRTYAFNHSLICFQSVRPAPGCSFPVHLLLLFSTIYPEVQPHRLQEFPLNTILFHSSLHLHTLLSSHGVWACAQTQFTCLTSFHGKFSRTQQEPLKS